MKLKKKTQRLVAGITAVVMAAGAITVSVPTMTTNADSDLGLDNYASCCNILFIFMMLICAAVMSEKVVPLAGEMIVIQKISYLVDSMMQATVFSVV